MKQYLFNYNWYRASACFEVSEKLTKEMAKTALDFFTWQYDKSANPIDELLKKYALTAIEVATAEDFNEYGVKCWFEETEGFMAIDGSLGIELKVVDRYNFDEDDLIVEITES